jgi:hypothetical protein
MLAGSLALALVAACSAPKTDAPAASVDSTPPPTASEAATSQAGMAMTARAMLPKMQAHYDSAAASPAMLKASGDMAMTRSMVNAMNADLKTAGMNPDAAYMTLADSVLGDLDRLPSLSGAGYDAAAKAHLDRVHRLMTAYERMVPAK